MRGIKIMLIGLAMLLIGAACVIYSIGVRDAVTMGQSTLDVAAFQTNAPEFMYLGGLLAVAGAVVMVIGYRKQD